MKIALFLSSIWLALASVFVSNEKTVLTGKINSDKGEPLVGTSVKVLKNRALVKNTVADTSGQYRFELEPGVYDVEFAHSGHVTQRLVNVEVLAKQENTVNVQLESGANLDEVVVRDFKKLATTYGGPGSGVVAMRMEGSRSASTPEPVGRKKGADAVKAEKSETRRDEPAAVPVPKTGMAKPKSKPAADEKPATTAPPAEGPAYETVVKDEVEKPAKAALISEKLSEGEGVAIAPSPGIPTQPAPRAGLLTAGEWNDLHNWNRHWTDLLADGEIDSYQTMYGIFPKQRYTVLLTNEQDFPIADAIVTLKRFDETVWETRTDNTGKAELWAGLFDKKEFSGLKIEARVSGKNHDLRQPKPAKDGLNRFKINTECAAPKNVDIVWAVDATGSMGDEIEYMKTELLDVIGRAKGRNPGLAFRMGTVFYRDVTDDYITKSSGLSADISKTVDFIQKQFAGGGGDYPEAVHSALEEAVFGQKWSENAIARICFLVLDASPHQSPEVNASLQKSIREAARLGIRIVPVTASGIQKDTEFLMKFFGLATNGTYVFLTDHSGIGGKHLEPTSDEYKVEPLNELLVRLITEYTSIETCEGKSQIRFDGDPQVQNGNGQNANWQALYYPNPASTQFMLELPFEVQSVTIYDSEGKAVRKLEKPQAGQNTVVVSDLADGFYTIRILKDGQMQSGKLMVVRA